MKRSSTIALLSALALVLGFLETMIPLPIAIPGFKLGLANAAILLALYRLELKDAAAVAFVKLLASTFLFGSPVMLAYSAAGTLLSFTGMALFRKLKGHIVVSSMIGAILHNVGQVIVASLFLHGTSVLWLLAPLSLAACFTGFIIGVAAQAALNAMENAQADARPLISFDGVPIEPGKLFVLTGPAGSGKTSALLQACGLDDTNPYAPAPLQGKAGFLFEDPQNQILASRVQDDTAFGLEYRGIETAVMKKRVAEALQEAGLSPEKNMSVESLSPLQQKQVALAGLFALDFPVLALDEPTAKLDEHNAHVMREIIEAASRRGICMLVATRDAELVSLADSVFTISEGKIAATEQIPEALTFESEQTPKETDPQNHIEEKNESKSAMGLAGLYREGESVCHKLHPSLKIICACIFIMLGFCAQSLMALGMLAVCTAVALAISHPQPALLLKACKPFLPLFLFIIVFDIFASGPTLALQSAIRLICVICISAVLMYTTSPTQLCDGIERIASPGAESGPRVARFALNMQLSFRFIPVLFQEFELTLVEKKQAPNSAKPSVLQSMKAISPSISHLFSSTMQRCAHVCAALENRAGNYEIDRKTRFRSYSLFRS